MAVAAATDRRFFQGLVGGMFEPIRPHGPIGGGSG